MGTQNDLTERWMREIAYHSERAALSEKTASYDLARRIDPSKPPMVESLLVGLVDAPEGTSAGKSALVPGCAELCAFDISPDMLRLAEELAAKQDTHVDFSANGLRATRVCGQQLRSYFCASIYPSF